MWSLAWSVVALYIVNGKTNLKKWQKWILVILINIITFSADWSSIAVMAILSMYSNRGNLKKQILSMSFWIMLYAAISYLFVSKTYGLITLAVILVYPLLKFYNGEKRQAKLDEMVLLFILSATFSYYRNTENNNIWEYTLTV